MDEENDYFSPCEVFLFILPKLFSYAVKYYDMGPPAPKEVLLRIIIAPKNPLPRPGLNPRTLGPVARTLTITPPR
jgi:hypothetical protein